MSKFPLVLGTVAASIATLVVVVSVTDTKPTTEDPFQGLRLSAPEVSIDDEILNAPFVTYQSDTFSYSVRYPGTWELDDTRLDFGGDVLSDPMENVVITFSETKDESIVSMEGLMEVAESITQSLKVDPSFELEETEKLYWKNRPAVFTSGVRIIGGERYYTREYHILRTDHGGMLNISITTLEQAETLYQEPIAKILKSLDVCPK